MSGQTDFYQPLPRDYEMMKKSEKEKNFTVYRLGPTPGTSFFMFNLNTNINTKTGKTYIDEKKLKWFNKKEFRQSIAYSLDRETMIDLSQNGLGSSEYSPISITNIKFYNPDVKKYHYDPEKAKQILDSIGYIDRNNDGFREDDEGNTIEFDFIQYPGPVIYTNLIRGDIMAIGLKVNLKVIEFNTLSKKLDASYDWDTMLMGLTGGVGDPHYSSHIWKSTSDYHMYHPKEVGENSTKRDWEKRIDEIFRLASVELDKEKRRELYYEFQDIVVENVPVIYLTNGESIFCLSNKFGNVNPTPFSDTVENGAFHNIEKIFVKR
jgi:peptide/nickel transport system substrate-binding protein